MKRFVQVSVVMAALALLSVTLINGARLTSAGNVAGAVLPEADRAAAALYKNYCATCHGNDGRSKTIKGKLKHARDLTDPTWQENVSDERIFNSIVNGRGKMPGFSKKMSDAETESLVSYVRHLRR